MMFPGIKMQGYSEKQFDALKFPIQTCLHFPIFQALCQDVSGV